MYKKIPPANFSERAKYKGHIMINTSSRNFIPGISSKSCLCHIDPFDGVYPERSRSTQGRLREKSATGVPNIIRDHKGSFPAVEAKISRYTRTDNITRDSL